MSYCLTDLLTCSVFLLTSKKIKQRLESYSGMELLQLENLTNHCYYKDGLGHGVFKSYHKNGQLEFVTQKKEGHQVGITMVYYDNGQLNQEFELPKSEIINEVKTYHKNGIIQLYGSENINGFQNIMIYYD